MIQFANKELKPQVWQMWKTVFEDKDEYIDLLFTEKYREDNTLLYIDEGAPVASLQMFPYTIRFYGTPVTFYYLAGLCTLPEHRNKGYMGQLIFESFKVMQHRHIALSILVPAEDWLFDYYEKYGYIQTFDKSAQAIDLNCILEEYSRDIDSSYSLFNKQFQQNDFLVLKNEEDFRIIVQENIQDGRREKYNLSGMSRVMNPLPLLNLYAKHNPSGDFTIRVIDRQFNTHQTYKIHNSQANVSTEVLPQYEVEIQMLTKLLFGYKLEEAPTNISSLFEQHHPILNLMLE